MGNSIIKNSRDFIVKVYVDNYNFNKGLCVLYNHIRFLEQHGVRTDNV